MCAAGLWDPVKIPDGLTCKNTFFDIPNGKDFTVIDGPATCPPPTEGWWNRNSVDPSLAFENSDIGPTPDWFGADFPGAGRHFERLLAEATAEDSGELLAYSSLPTTGCNKVNAGGELHREPLRLPVTGFEPRGKPGHPLLHAPSATGGRVLVELAREIGLPPMIPDPTCNLRPPTPELPCFESSDGERPVTKARRRRGSKDSKDPNRCRDDPSWWLPTATFVDLGVLVRVESLS